MRKASTWMMAMALSALASLPVRAGKDVHTPSDVGTAVKEQVHYAGEQMHEHLDYLKDDAPPHSSCYFQMDALNLRRDLTNTNFPATSLGVRGPIIAELQDLDFLTETGVRITAGHRCNEWFSVEGTYFGQQEWFDQFIVTDPGSRLFGVLNRFGTVQQPIFPSPPFPQTFGIGNNTFQQSGDYKSRLHNGELNVICDLIKCNWDDHNPEGLSLSFSAIVGLRYLRLKEFFSLRTKGSAAPGLPFDPGARADYIIDCENDALGGQFGGKVKVQVCDGFALNCEAKCAIMGNGVEQSSVATFVFFQPQFIPGILTASDGTMVTSYLGQLTSFATIELTKHITFRAGYDIFWLNKRALAPDQVDANATINNFITPMINTKGTTMFYGTMFGLEVKF